MQTAHIEIAVNNAAAAQREAQQPLAYVEELEKLELVEGVHTQAGRAADRSGSQPDAAHTRPAPGVPNVPEFNDRKQMIAVLSDVAAGDVLALTWRPATIGGRRRCRHGHLACQQDEGSRNRFRP